MVNVACEQAPQGTLVAGQEKEGELATSSLEFEFHFQFPWNLLSKNLWRNLHFIWYGYV